MPVFLDSVHELVVSDLTDQDGNLVSDASVEATLYEQNEKTKLTGVTQPVSLSAVGNGKYVGTFDSGLLNIASGDLIKIKYKATKGSTTKTWWRSEYVLKDI